MQRFSKEAAVLRLLKDTLESATADASRQFLRPVVSRVDPLVRQLIPSASLSFGEDMNPLSLTRGGRTDDAHRLSRGTQEQLAVLTRPAFAEMIIDKGGPASVILDDALVYSDDARFEAMLDILAKSAERLQIIVLTCRASLFRADGCHAARALRIALHHRSRTATPAAEPRSPIGANPRRPAWWSMTPCAARAELTSGRLESRADNGLALVGAVDSRVPETVASVRVRVADTFWSRVRRLQLGAKNRSSHSGMFSASAPSPPCGIG